MGSNGIEEFEELLMSNVIAPVAEASGMEVGDKFVFETPIAPGMAIVCSAYLWDSVMKVAVVLDGGYAMPQGDWVLALTASGWRVARIREEDLCTPSGELDLEGWVGRLRNQVAAACTPWPVRADDPLAFERLGLRLLPPCRNPRRAAYVENRQRLPRAHESWGVREEDLLSRLEAEGRDIDEIAALLQRTYDEVERRSGRLSRRASRQGMRG